MSENFKYLLIKILLMLLKTLINKFNILSVEKKTKIYRNLIFK